LYIDNLPEYGFGNQTNYATTGEYNTKGVLMSTFELGFTFKMGEKNAFMLLWFWIAVMEQSLIKKRTSLT
jgi:hypothetical protein